MPFASYLVGFFFRGVVRGMGVGHNFIQKQPFASCVKRQINHLIFNRKRQVINKIFLKSKDVFDIKRGWPLK